MRLPKALQATVRAYEAQHGKRHLVLPTLQDIARTPQTGVGYMPEKTANFPDDYRTLLTHMFRTRQLPVSFDKPGDYDVATAGIKKQRLIHVFGAGPAAFYGSPMRQHKQPPQPAWAHGGSAKQIQGRGHPVPTGHGMESPRRWSRCSSSPFRFRQCLPVVPATQPPPSGSAVDARRFRPPHRCHRLGPHHC
jgi:hypothetical protein